MLCVKELCVTSLCALQCCVWKRQRRRRRRRRRPSAERKNRNPTQRCGEKIAMLVTSTIVARCTMVMGCAKVPGTCYYNPSNMFKQSCVTSHYKLPQPWNRWDQSKTHSDAPLNLIRQRRSQVSQIYQNYCLLGGKRGEQTGQSHFMRQLEEQHCEAKQSPAQWKHPDLHINTQSRNSCRISPALPHND